MLSVLLLSLAGNVTNPHPDGNIEFFENTVKE